MSDRPGKVVVILSGGLDSTTLLYKMHKERGVAAAVSFNYGQKHSKELEYAENAADKLGVPWFLIDLSESGLVPAITPGGSSLLKGNEDIPEGHYAEDNMKSTVVPNRNMMMISIAGAIAVAHGARAVATGVHAGDHAVYPDCRVEFVDKAAETLFLANEGMSDLDVDAVIAPYYHATKADIAYDALELGVPLYETWSCYKGGEIHCGKCGTCVERLEAIDEALTKANAGRPNQFVRLVDHTKYEDSEYWKQAVAENREKNK